MRRYICSQVELGAACGKPAVAHYTWPGRDETGICADHIGKLRAVAKAMGLSIQLIGLDEQRL